MVNCPECNEPLEHVSVRQDWYYMSGIWACDEVTEILCRYCGEDITEWWDDQVSDLEHWEYFDPLKDEDDDE